MQQSAAKSSEAGLRRNQGQRAVCIEQTKWRVLYFHDKGTSECLRHFRVPTCTKPSYLLYYFMTMEARWQRP